MRAPIVIVVLALAEIAHAEPPGLTWPTDVQPPGLTPPTQAPGELATQRRRPKERGAAVLGALVGSIAPYFIYEIAQRKTTDDRATAYALVGGVLLPSAGHWYAGKLVTTGMALRAGGALAMLLMYGDPDSRDGAIAMGVLAMTGGAIWDIATAGDAVEDWNRAHAAVAPMRVGSGYGAGLVGRF
jgi:hypothetical protein